MLMVGVGLLLSDIGHFRRRLRSGRIEHKDILGNSETATAEVREPTLACWSFLISRSA
jgi:hypothetical protein